jgi:hypothetical protein
MGAESFGYVAWKSELYWMKANGIRRQLNHMALLAYEGLGSLETRSQGVSLQQAQHRITILR